MTAVNLEHMIVRALEQENHTHALRKVFSQSLTRLHDAIPMEHDTDTSLVDFVKDYISKIPSILTAMEAAAKEAKIGHVIDPILKIVYDFFASETQAEELGLSALMDEAYLTYRLFEELNDIYQVKVGMPLLPLDLTTSNVIMHNLLGDAFANKLDQAVFSIIQQMIAKQKAIEEQSTSSSDQHWFANKADNTNDSFTYCTQ